MKTILFFILINIVIAIRLGDSKHLSFLNCSIRFNNINRDSNLSIKSDEIDPELLDDYSSDSDSSDSTPLLNDEELNMINEYVNNIKSGVYGSEQQKEFEKMNKEETERIMKEDPLSAKELLEFKDDKLDKELREVFDMSKLPTGEGKTIDWDELEKKIEEQGRTEGFNVEELRSMVHSMYHKKGLLNDQFKVLEVEGIKLNWRQSLDTLELWFVVSSETKKKDYEVKFLPSKLSIFKEDKVILEKELDGKIDCDGCFWTMFKNPNTGAKYVNINLTKRSPKYNNMWDQLFK